MARWHSKEYYWWPKSGPLANRRLIFYCHKLQQCYGTTQGIGKGVHIYFKVCVGDVLKACLLCFLHQGLKTSKWALIYDHGLKFMTKVKIIH